MHGRLAHLIDVKDGQYSTALGVAAGGKLYNVVIKDEATGSDLLKARLRQRETMIPLNKIQYKTLSKNQVQAAYNLVGKDKVATALSLIDYLTENRCCASVTHW